MPYRFTHEIGSVTKRGTRQYAGRRVVVLVDKGDRPATSPNKLFVAANRRS